MLSHMDLTAVQVKQFNADVTKTIEKFVQVSVVPYFVFATILYVIVRYKICSLILYTVFMIP